MSAGSPVSGVQRMVAGVRQTARTTAGSVVEPWVAVAPQPAAVPTPAPPAGSSGPGRDGRPRRGGLRPLIVLVVLLGIGVLAISSVQWIDAGTSVSWPLLGGVAVLVLGDVAVLRLRFGHNLSHFNWGEAAMIFAVSLTKSWPAVVVAGAGALLVRQLLIGRAVHKAAFNAASFAIGVWLASLVTVVIMGNTVIEIKHWSQAAALAAAAAVYFLVAGALVTAAVARSSGQSFAAVWRKGVLLRWLMFAGNTAVGLLVVWLAGPRGSSNVSLSLVVPFFLLLLYVVYRTALRAQQERTTWQELQAASHDLNRVDIDEVARVVLVRATTLFAAEYVELTLGPVDDPRATVVAYRTPGEGGSPGPDSGLWRYLKSTDAPVTVDVRRTDPAVAVVLRRQRVALAVVTPLETARGRVGALAVGFRGPVRLAPREEQVLVTFANQVATSVQNAQIFSESDADRVRLAGIIDAASDGILLVDAEGRVQSWNPAMERLTGRTSDHALGASLFSVAPASTPDGVACTGDWLRGLLGGADHTVVQVTMTRSDGNLRDVALSVSAIRAAGHEQEPAAVVVARDITAQREVEQAKQDFIATVSHELRTPLTPIKGFLMLLRRPDFKPDARRRDAILDQMLDQTKQLERLVEDLLSASSLQYGRFGVNPELVVMDDIVARAVRDFSATRDRPIEVAAVGPAGVVTGDPDRLQQVVANLLSNADKYSPAGAPVSVAVSVAPESVELRVRDYGGGIPEDQRQAVFEPFHRLGHHLTRQTRGTGLGLHIARRLVEAMDGSIEVAPTEGPGATFLVSLPLAPAPDPAALADVDGPADGGPLVDATRRSGWALAGTATGGTNGMAGGSGPAVGGGNGASRAGGTQAASADGAAAAKTGARVPPAPDVIRA